MIVISAGAAFLLAGIGNGIFLMGEILMYMIKKTSSCRISTCRCFAYEPMDTGETKGKV